VVLTKVYWNISQFLVWRHPASPKIPYTTPYQRAARALGGMLRTTTCCQTRKTSKDKHFYNERSPAGREAGGKVAVGKYSLQVLLSFRCLQVNKTDWGSEAVVLVLRRSTY